jgi:hypothetical protein
VLPDEAEKFSKILGTVCRKQALQEASVGKFSERKSIYQTLHAKHKRISRRKIMQQKKVVIGVIGAVVAIAGWAAFRPELLFVNKTVNESFPTAQAASAKDAPVALVEGMFRSGAHETKGTATIHRLADGKRVLRLTNFKTSNGPDVHVYLVAANDVKDNATVKSAGFIDLGSIKGNEGDQNYDIPANADLNKYRAATIWCARFGVNFGTAPLMQAAQAAPTAPQSVSAGMFHGVAHETKGDATVYQLPDGKLTLRLTNFETSNGPDVRVYLVAAEDAKDNATVKNAGFVELGKLKGNQGDQNYDIPAGTDLTKYRAVTIWCARFGVNFATAPLTKPAA